MWLEATLLGAFSAGWVAVHVWLAWHRHPHALALTLSLDAAAGLLLCAAFVRPDVFEIWMREDGWAEWATFWSFLAAGMLAFRGMRDRHHLPSEGRGMRWAKRLAWSALALFGVFVAGEEISWGQRLLAFKPPEIFLEANYQQELNVHNFLKGERAAGFSLETRYLVAWIALAYGMVLPSAARWLPSGPVRAVAADVAPPWWLTPWFLLVAAVELAYPVELAGEACELLLGLAFLAALAVRSRIHVRRTSAVRSFILVPVVAAPLLMGLITPPTIEALVYGPAQPLVRRTRRDLERLAMDVRQPGVVRPLLWRRDRVHKRVFTAVRSGYLRFGTNSRFLERRASPALDTTSRARHDRLGYFLDPWHNPIWVYFDREQARLGLYSFGANRMRDSHGLDEGGRFAGDDIGHWIELTPP